LFVGSLPWAIDDAGLAQLFSQAGTVVSAQVVKDRETGRSRGFGFVEMETPELAQTALNELNGSQLGGRSIAVKEAKPQERR
jgi:RNA recognition motif-containing protein